VTEHSGWLHLTQTMCLQKIPT